MTILGKYELHEQLGKGGFGTVYRATDNIGRTVAIKVLKPGFADDPEVLDRFRREALAASSLFHPHIATILDFDEADGRVFIVMRYIDGQPLDRLLKERSKLPWEEAVKIIEQVAEALQFAHEKGFIHRDIKPGNIIISPTEGAVLTDFGLVKAVTASGLSTTGVMLGTPAYIAPEIWSGKQASPATDVYSLACVLYEMITGEVLFDGESTPEIMKKHFDEIQLPDQWSDTVPACIPLMLKKALSIEVENRYQAMNEFTKALSEPVKSPENSVEKIEEAVQEQPLITQPKTNYLPPTLPTSIPPTTTTTPTIPPIISPEKYSPPQISNGKKKRNITIWACLAGFVFVGIISLLIINNLSKGVSEENLPTPTNVVHHIPTQTPVQEAQEIPSQTPAQLLTYNFQPIPKGEMKVCEVTDTGGIDDKSFNATAWKGVTDAETQFGIEVTYLESKEVADFEKNINAFLENKCKLIITVGYLLNDATKAAAEANPNVEFSIVDNSYDPVIANISSQSFQTDEAAFLAGYLAAGVSKTRTVGTFGGMQIPTVTIFMDGFARGVAYYNTAHSASVKVLGWDPIAQTGLFTNDFSDQQKGNDMAVSLMDEGADIILPVAGPVGLGAAAAVKARGNAYIIGVDSDWYLTAPEYRNIELTSVMKLTDVTTVNVIKSGLDGTFTGGNIVGNLANGGVALAPFHDLDSIIPTSLKTELDQVKADILSGKVVMNPEYKQ